MPDPSILIVDDDETYRNIFVGNFREERFRVLEARDGEEAWETLQRETPDVLFTGILMPKLDGFSLIERMRGDSRYARTKTFILSHHGRPEDKTRADALRVDGFFTMGYIPVAEITLRVCSSLPKSRVFTIHFDPARLDADSRTALEEIGKALLCERCDEPYAMRLQPDPLRPSGFFSAHIECPDCAKYRDSL